MFQTKVLFQEDAQFMVENPITYISLENKMIRLATHDDIEVIKNINESCLPENYDLDTYTKHLEIYGLTYVLESESQIVGYIMGRIEDSVEVHITSIAVLPEARGKMFGQRLVLTLLVTAKKRHLMGCSLQVRKSNDIAQYVYKKLGFQPIRELVNYYGDEDGVFMRRRIG